MPEPNDQFTPDQQAQLEAAKLARINAELELTSKQAELAEITKKEREARQNRALRDAAADAARFHNLDIVTKIAVTDYDIAFDDQGNGTGLINGARRPLADVFRQIALDNENLVDGRSLRHLKDAEERKKAEAEVLCKSEMSVEQKIAFIDQHGLEKFEALPLRRPRIVEVKTFADYLALPLKSRIAYVEKYGPDAAAKLPRN